MTSSRAAIALAGMALACASEVALPPPAPASVEPALGYSNMSVPVTIHGDAFYLRASQSVEGRDGTSVSAGFRAWLGAVELEEVAWVDASTLAATVPAGLGPGLHPLVVEGPYGTQGSVAGAYTVLAPPGTRLTVHAVAVQDPVSVLQNARVDVTATNEGPDALRGTRVLLKQVVDGVAKQPVPGDARPFALSPGESMVVRYEIATSAAGTLVFEAKASAVEVTTGAGVASEKVRTSVTVQTPPDLIAVSTLSASTVPIGGTVIATLAVANRGEAAARVTPSAVSSGTATLAGLGELPEVVIPGGAIAGPLTWTIVAGGEGSAEIVLSVAGVDENSGTTVDVSVSAGSIQVQPP
jgi:hypothetical protein